MAKTANLYARIEPEVKEEAEKILDSLGIPASNAINMFYKQIILHRGLPFEVKMPAPKLVDFSRISEQERDNEIAKGYDDMLSGRSKPAQMVFSDIKKDYGL